MLVVYGSITGHIFCGIPHFWGITHWNFSRRQNFFFPPQKFFDCCNFCWNSAGVSKIVNGFSLNFAGVPKIVNEFCLNSARVPKIVNDCCNFCLNSARVPMIVNDCCNFSLNSKGVPKIIIDFLSEFRCNPENF